MGEIIVCKVGHIGLKVKDLEKTTEFYQEILHCELIKSYNDDNLKMVLVKCGDVTLEFIQEAKAIETRENCVIEHIAFKVEDIESMIIKLKDKGVECISKDVEAFEEVKLFFFRGPDGEMLELIQ